jgi:Trp operon repressor
VPKNTKAFDIIAAHVVETLPDSIKKRKELLESLSRILPNQARSTIGVRVMLDHLLQHNIEQRQLTLDLNGNGSVTGTNHANGDGK